MPPTTLTSLPDELLLSITQNINDRHRNTTLRALALVSRRLAPIAQEVLIRVPKFQIRHIHNYLWALGHHSQWIPQITSLEIWSTSSDREVTKTTDPRYKNLELAATYPAIRAAPQDLWREDGETMRQKCLEMMAYYTEGNQSDYALWTFALDTDVIASLLGVLLVALVNLKELHVAATWLEVLVFPADMWYMLYLDARAMCPQAVFNFRYFQRLREISVSMAAVRYSTYHQDMPEDPWTFLPRTLERIRITEGILWPQSVDIYWDAKRECASVGIELFLYFSGAAVGTQEAGRSLWSLREAGEMADVESDFYGRKVIMTGQLEWPVVAYVCEWDAAGNEVMHPRMVPDQTLLYAALPENWKGR
ncbi:hypothetical protein CC80DRAFT_553414 [Byssothecium circinans]|uniref:F-box domain-containing protein n=1 Tax=Byssothecium circinans TaxID=147558 RepID=A0A6A5TER9_9PLEO|nr:hypothetical protein CC80DRAFT_553414 [Byssothecium circinans]